MPMLPNLDAQLIPYSRNRAGQSAHRPSTAPSASHAPSACVSPSAHEGLLGDVTNTAHSQDFHTDRHSQLQLVSDFSSGSLNHDYELQAAAKQSRVTVMKSEAHWQEPAPEQQQQCYVPQQDASVTSVQQTKVSVNTAGSVKKSVFMVSEHHLAVQPDASAPSHASQTAHVTGLLSPAASALASCPPGAEEADIGSGPDSLPYADSGHFRSHSPHALTHEGNALQDITSTGLHQSDAGLGSTQSSAVGNGNYSAIAFQDRALQNSPMVNTPRHRASHHSSDAQGKANSHSPAPGAGAMRQSGGAEHMAQAQDSLQEAALLDAVREVHHAHGDASVTALQALQLQIGSTRDSVLQTCLSQVCPC